VLNEWWKSNYDFILVVLLILIGLIIVLIISNVIFRNKLIYRTKQLEESQLLLLQKDRLSHIGQIAASIAHEINNPLTGIINGTQFLSELMENTPDSKIKEDIQMVRENTERIMAIVNRLMNYGGSRLDFVKLNLNEIIEKALRLTEAQFHQSNIVIQKNFDKNLALIHGDEDRLLHVVLHVLSNAIDSLDLKYPKMAANMNKIIMITTFMDDRFIIAKIRDFGMGISDENKDLIFKPFFSTKKETGSRYGGTGLGLNICARIMAEHGASIQIHSKEQEWAEVTLKFKNMN
jgi:signal transduction histidine kinase